MTARVDALLRQIAQLPETERRELLMRLRTEAGRGGEFASNTLQGDADYIVIFDGGSRGNPGQGYGSYAIIIGGKRVIRRLNLGGDMTNNEAEYGTLLSALDDVQSQIELADRLPEEFTVEIRGDSALVINQLSGAWQARDARMQAVRDGVRRQIARFKANRLVQQPRSETVKVLGH